MILSYNNIVLMFLQYSNNLDLFLIYIYLHIYLFTDYSFVCDSAKDLHNENVDYVLTVVS